MAIIQGRQNALTNVFRANAILNEFSGGTNRNLNMLFYLNTVHGHMPRFYTSSDFAPPDFFCKRAGIYGLSLLFLAPDDGAIAIYLFIFYL